MSKTPTKPRSLEHHLQAAFVRWARLASGHMPALEMLHAIPNGGARHAVTGAQLKAEGVRKGVPDLCLPVAVGPYHGLYIEMKIRPNKPSPEQLWWMERLNRNGYKAVVCYELQEAIDITTDYLRGRA